MKGILGIDPGLSGGIALIRSEGPIVESLPQVGDMLDLAALGNWVRQYRDEIEIAFLEKVSAMPHQGVSGMFKFGRVSGAIEGVLAALQIPYEHVLPATWMKVMHSGVPELKKSLKKKGVMIEKKDTKEMSRMAASRLFPGLDLRASPKSKITDEGMVEALLIAEYGRRLRFGKAQA